jgi:hypothetical protein
MGGQARTDRTTPIERGCGSIPARVSAFLARKLLTVRRLKQLSLCARSWLAKPKLEEEQERSGVAARLTMRDADSLA